MWSVLAEGRHVLGPGLYETLLHTGDRDGYPVLTFTADTAHYLAAVPGASGHWTPGTLESALRDATGKKRAISHHGGK